MGLAEISREMEESIFPLADKFRIQDNEMKIQMELDHEDVKTTIAEVLNEVHSMRSKGNPNS